MSAQPFQPLTDEALRAQLSRRAAAPVPPSLAGDVFEALDRVPVRVRGAGLPLFGLGGARHARIPRLAAAALSLALVLAVGLGTLAILPALRSPSASVAGAQPLTTAQLAALVGDAATPVNATLVANATIESKPDACPMDRYPTVGILVGTVKQVCVMGSGVNATLRAQSASGIFAFRVIGPGTLGLLGQLTPKADGSLTYRVVDDWPLQGKTFLVDGWLGETQSADYCLPATTFQGDVLDPVASGCPYEEWLSTDQTAGELPPRATASGQPDAALALLGRTRRVEAAGTRLVDGIARGTTVHALFVVRSVTEACPGASPVDSKGCSAWRVLARVSDIGLGKSSPSPAASRSASPTGPPDGSTTWDPLRRPLTAAELGRALAGGTAKTGQALVANVAVTPSDACSTSPSAYASWGQVQGVSPPVCVVASPSISIAPPAAQPAILAFRVVGPSTIAYLGFVTSASGRLAFSADGYWPAGAIFLVQGLLGSPGLYCPPADRTPAAGPSGSWGCRTMWLLNPDKVPTQYGGIPSGANILYRTDGDGLGANPEGVGVYLVQTAAATCSADPSPTTSTCSSGNLLARVDPLTVPPTALPSPPPSSPVQSATPTPSGSPDVLMSPDTTVLIGKDGGPLTLDQLQAAFLTDPKDLVWQLAIVSGALPPSIGCLPVDGPAGASASAPACASSHPGSGPWLVRLNDYGQPQYAGRVEPGPAGLAWDVASLSKAEPVHQDSVFLVTGWLLGSAGVKCDQGYQGETPPPCDEYAWLSSRHETGMILYPAPSPDDVRVWDGDAHRFGATWDGSALAAIHGTFLVSPQWQGNNSSYVVATAQGVDH